MNRKPKIEKVEKEAGKVLDGNIEKLKSLFPEAVSEKGVDFEKLRATLGDVVDNGPERYSFSWAGKRDAIRLLQTPSRATLIPAPKESINFDTTQNLFIEGDNLEVLKLLYKPYFGRVKMIYIDPPYNTGNDFVYPDNFADPLDTYLKLTGQKDSEGNLLASNPESNGRYHSAWLTMMYPRLFLARQLLQQDGVIFISIDDNEIHNLRLVMNEVFGEENFIAQIIVKSNPRGSMSPELIGMLHEYVLLYSKNKQSAQIIGHELSPEMLQEYKHQDGDMKKYRFLGLRQRGGFWRRSERPLLYYPIYVNPNDGSVSLQKNKDFKVEVFPIQPTTGVEGAWRWNKGKVASNLNVLTGKQINRADNKEEWDIFQKDYLQTEDNGIRRTKARTIWDEKEINYQNGTTELKGLFGGKQYFDFPKPVALLKNVVSMVDVSDNEYVLDFFAGSCTTSHAVIDLNREDGGDRRFIMVQLPEPTENKEYPTIAEIGKERIRRVIANIKKERAGELALKERATPEDLGFKVFKLAESNYKLWTGVDDKTPEGYTRTMELFTEPLKPGWKPGGLIWEVVIKEGFSLTSRIEEVKDVKGLTVQRVTDLDKGQSFLICLDDKIRLSALKPLNLGKGDLFVCRDSALDDEAAANLAIQCRLKTI